MGQRGQRRGLAAASERTSGWVEISVAASTSARSQRRRASTRSSRSSTSWASSAASTASRVRKWLYSVALATPE